MNLYTILTTYLFDAFTYSFCVWYYNLTYCVLVGRINQIWDRVLFLISQGLNWALPKKTAVKHRLG